MAQWTDKETADSKMIKIWGEEAIQQQLERYKQNTNLGVHYFTERTGPDWTKFTHYSLERTGQIRCHVRYSIVSSAHWCITANAVQIC